MTDIPARVKDLHEWAHDPATPDDEWGPVTAPVFRAIEAEATAAAEQRLRDARHAIVQASINLANEDTVAAHADIERVLALLSKDPE